MKGFSLTLIAVVVATRVVVTASSVADQLESDTRERGRGGRPFRTITESEDRAKETEGAAPARRLAKAATVCTMGASGVAQATVDEYTLKTEFTCGDGSEEAYLKPALPSDAQKCFETSECTENNYKQVDGTVTFAQNKFTLALKRMPARTDKLFYKCEHNGNKCVLTVKMPDEPSKNECTLSKAIQLEITENNPSVEFICKTTAEAGKELLPSPAITQVYQGFDCSTEKVLKELLPDAKLENTDETKYMLSVSTLPPRMLELCYKCHYKNTEATDKPCLVKVTVNASRASGSSPDKPLVTTTTAVTTSSSSLASASFQMVACLALMAGVVRA